MLSYHKPKIKIANHLQHEVSDQFLFDYKLVMSAEPTDSLDSVQPTHLLSDVRSGRPKGPSTRPKSVHNITNSTTITTDINIDEPGDQIMLPSVLRQRGGGEFAANIGEVLRKRMQVTDRPKTMGTTNLTVTNVIPGVPAGDDEVESTTKVESKSDQIVLPSVLKQRNGGQLRTPKTSTSEPVPLIATEEVTTTSKVSKPIKVENKIDNGITGGRETSNLKPTEILKELRTQNGSVQENMVTSTSSSISSLKSEVEHCIKAIETIEASVNNLKLHFANLTFQLKPPSPTN